MLRVLHARDDSATTSVMQVVDLVRDGLNDTMPEFGEETNRGESITDAWDFVQENVSQ